MKKLFVKLMSIVTALTILAAVAFVSGLAVPVSASANDIVSFDRSIPAAGGVTNKLSTSYTAKPVWLNVWSAYPTNGTATVKLEYTDAGGTVRRTSLGAIKIAEGGVLSTNLSALTTQYLFPREKVIVEFSAATNGVFQLVGELNGIGK